MGTVGTAKEHRHHPRALGVSKEREKGRTPQDVRI